MDSQHTKQLKFIRRVMDAADKYGHVEIVSSTRGSLGVSSREVMLAEQEKWVEDDACKHFDFSGYAYWIESDQEAPIGFDIKTDAVAAIMLGPYTTPRIQ